MAPAFRRLSLLHGFLILFLACSSLADVTRKDGKNCSCGFYDPSTKNVFTDSIILYFNETTSLPIAGFHVEDFEHRAEKSWNSIYRQGATPSNLAFNDSALDFFVSPSTPDHLVMGAGIKTLRHDIQYGSFRTYMRSPGKNIRGGSALSMILEYNTTQSMELSLMNTDDNGEAWVGQFRNGEFPSYDYGTNYTVLGNGSSEIGISSPWDFTEYRVDWTKDEINFFVGTNLTRNVTRKQYSDLFSVPAPLEIKHWSTGNTYSMQGPPTERSLASVGWMRFFFNSSVMSSTDHHNFDKACQVFDTCSIDDVSLRGSSPYPEEATKKWVQADPRRGKRIPAIVIAVLCIVWTSLLLMRAVIIQAPWKKWGKSKQEINNTSNRARGSNDQINLVGSEEDLVQSSFTSPEWTRPHTPETRDENNMSITAIPAYPSSNPTSPPPGYVSNPSLTQKPSSVWDSNGTTPWDSRIQSPSGSKVFSFWDESLTPKPLSLRAVTPPKDRFDSDEIKKVESEPQVFPSFEEKEKPNVNVAVTEVTEVQAPASAVDAIKPVAPTRKRVDYLAGIVALCALLVTVMHFGLTYVPALVIPGAPYHYKSEVWAQKIISPIFLNQMWLGVFFTTSTRFLCDKYLKDGNLKHIAQAATRRTPRLMIPVTCIVMLEYFLIDCGVTKYLEYVPSVSWSTWGFVSRFPSFGHFISEVLELVFLIPNAVPQITFNYCTGVLWTIAVQLQYSWLTLLGAVVIREIRTPWKRFGYYAFVVTNNWYAQSWGSYFWVGVMLTDLDVTYKYKMWLHARRGVYYSLIAFLWILVILGFTANVAPNWTDYNFPVHETGIHPDIETGRPIMQTINYGYPPYYVPRVNGLLFAVGLQTIVEISPFVQRCLSNRFLVLVFPHIFTIYLIHGLVFWSWGAWLCIFLQERRLPYAINMLIVGLTSYALMALALPILTPIMEALGKDITNQVWTGASQKPPPRRRTLFPFPDDLFTRRQNKGEESEKSGVSVRETDRRSIFP